MFRNGGKIGSTRDAHRLIHLSKTQSKPAEIKDALAEKLFEAYPEQEKDISERGVLRGIATDAGLNAVQVDEWLTSDEGGIEVDEEAANNREVVKEGVPHFIIQGVHRVDGAQDVQDFLEVFAKIQEGN